MATRSRKARSQARRMRCRSWARTSDRLALSQSLATGFEIHCTRKGADDGTSAATLTISPLDVYPTAGCGGRFLASKERLTAASRHPLHMNDRRLNASPDLKAAVPHSTRLRHARESRLQNRTVGKRPIADSRSPVLDDDSDKNHSSHQSCFSWCRGICRVFRVQPRFKQCKTRGAGHESAFRVVRHSVSFGA